MKGVSHDGAALGVSESCLSHLDTYLARFAVDCIERDFTSLARFVDCSRKEGLHLEDSHIDIVIPEGELSTEAHEELSMDMLKLGALLDVLEEEHGIPLEKT